MTADKEARLIEKAKKGDEIAFEMLVLNNQRIVYNLAFRNLGNAQDAEDVAQEVFIKAFTALPSFRGESRFSVWLYRLTQNACTDFVRKNRKATVVSLFGDDDAVIDVPDTAPSPEDVASTDETAEKVHRAIEKLPDDKREIILLREFSGYDYSEIAAALGINEGTVKSRLSRAREALAAILRTGGTFSPETSSKTSKGGGADD